MTIVGAFLVPGSPLPLLKEANPPWGALARAARTAGERLAAARPDVLLIYSTQWIAVLDELWQARPHSRGIHVDENWHEYGDLPVDVRVDVQLVNACIASASKAGIRSRGVDYDRFPIDTGTIVANAFLNPGGEVPVVIASNNLYHDFAGTEVLGSIAAKEADRLGRRAAVIAVGGLSSSYFDREIEIAEDRIVDMEADLANAALLEAMKAGGADRLRDHILTSDATGRADMRLKHLGWLLGAVGETQGATVHGYGPTYGAGAAVVEFHLPAQSRGPTTDGA